MRCDVLMSTSFLDEDSKSTDVSVWTPNAIVSPTGKSTYKTGPLHLDHKNTRPATATTSEEDHDKSERSSQGSKPSATHTHKHSHTIDECDEEYFSNLRQKCGDLVWECLQGLISVLDAKDFKALQGELESISCSYLSCARYGDACCQPGSRLRGKLRPFFIVFGSLLISLVLALAYYFTWIYAQTVDDTICYDDNDDKTYAPELTNIRKGIPPLVNRTSHI